MIAVQTSRKEATRRLGEFWSVFRRKRIGLFGLGLLLSFIVIALLAPILGPHDPYYERNLSGYFNQPEWFAYFGSRQPPNIFSDTTQILKLASSQASYDNREKAYTTSLPLNIDVPVEFLWEPPARLWLAVNISAASPASLTVKLTRPDGTTYEFLKTPLPTGPNFTQYVMDTWALNFRQRLFPDDYTLPLAERKLFTEVVDNKTRPLIGEYLFSFRFDGEGTLRVGNIDLQLYGRRYGALGTDEFGRDIWSQLIKGTWFALIIGVLAALLAVGIGIVYGLVSGYYGRATDEVMMRTNDVLLSIPTLPLLIVLTTVLRGASLWVVVMLIGFLGWNGIARIGRSVALSVKEQMFVEAARSVGSSDTRIMFRHIFPHILPLAYAQLALTIPSAVLLEAALSFLGLTEPSLMTWGKMLSNAQRSGMTANWWWVVPPGLFLTLLSLSFVFIGHAIDEILNPRLRKRA